MLMMLIFVHESMYLFCSVEYHFVYYTVHNICASLKVIITFVLPKRIYKVVNCQLRLNFCHSGFCVQWEALHSKVQFTFLAYIVINEFQILLVPMSRRQSFGFFMKTHKRVGIGNSWPFLSVCQYDLTALPDDIWRYVKTDEQTVSQK